MAATALGSDIEPDVPGMTARIPKATGFFVPTGVLTSVLMGVVIVSLGARAQPVVRLRIVMRVKMIIEPLQWVCVPGFMIPCRINCYMIGLNVLKPGYELFKHYTTAAFSHNLSTTQPNPGTFPRLVDTILGKDDPIHAS